MERCCWMCRFFEPLPGSGGMWGDCREIGGLLSLDYGLAAAVIRLHASESCGRCPCFDLSADAATELADAERFRSNPDRYNGVRPGADFPATLKG